ncbi:MAG TPA: N-6 DNA methylase [Thermoanaerobaculia bacterium]|nr:N-6 DNA methylase [Thermoanaerobaculia bacterium]
MSLDIERVTRRPPARVPRPSPNGAAEAFWRTLQALEAEIQDIPHSGGRHAQACAVTAATLEAFWARLQPRGARSWEIPRPVLDQPLPPLPGAASRLAAEAGVIAAQQEPVTGGYMIGELYTALLPSELRARHGIFYTPPALVGRLLALASQAGTDWSVAHVLDPACGGGAFLTPVALRMAAALRAEAPEAVFRHIVGHLRGFELDPFGAWMSQVLLEAALLDLCRSVKKRLPTVVTVCDALTTQPGERRFDLVIGNPPYGRVTLSPDLRETYRRSLYGHANAYGLFMDLAVRWTRPGGTIAYVTPTGFLGGQYFQHLRALMAEEAPPVAVDLVTSRRRVFSGVLQETLLAAYRRNGPRRKASVHVLSLTGEAAAEVVSAGTFSLPSKATDPWLVPRSREQEVLISRLREMPHRLSDYGYKVSTGPLVWNRHKPQLRDATVAGAYPILWSECVTPDGRFEHRTEKKNHSPYLATNPGQEWLLTREPCVLVQRTTAKEQRRRLIAAELPVRFIRKHRAVSVENHLNMVKPIVAAPPVPLRVIAAILNSEIADSVFRCISGSVAVSATELECLPLPPPKEARRLLDLLEAGAPSDAVEGRLRSLYLREKADAAA